MSVPDLSKPRRLFLIACEESGDRLGGALMRALRTASPRAIEFVGVGASHMAEQGLTTLFPIDDLAIVGFNAVFARLPLLVRRINETVDAVLREKPDGLIIIDSPDFTHRVARRVRKTAPEIPIVDYVSPSVWAWRPGRARAMRRYVDHLLALLPFEPDAHKRLGGPPCTYVGHPLTEVVADLRPDERERARRKADPPVLLVLPGSRSSEIARHIDLIGETVQLLGTRCGPLELVLPTVPAVRAKVEQGAARWPVTPKIVVEPADKWRAFRTARAALAVSGTVTLELALAGVPSVVIYRVSLFEEAIGRMFLRGSTIVLANLVLGENAMPEFLQRDATPERLAAAVAPLLGPSPERVRQVDAFARLDRIMEIGQVSPSARAAEIVLRTVERRDRT
ncbi:MAG: lipid-A-disaccharide synthase [Xanthobacteraceae bacterium]|nr:lipid-A-disaccharide synthase [Xanthobacteraceae bacterium]